jgi:glycosyltransferase involved in cell wall biosynthesis
MMERGHDVSLITERPLNIHGWVDFNSCNLIYTGQLDWREHFPDQLHSTMKTLAPVIDVVHFSNEPDWPMEVIRDAIGDKPLIYDIHDMVSQRSGKIDDLEKKAFECADAFIVPSEEYLQIVKERTGKSAICIKSCVPEKLFPTIQRVPQRRGIVYEGGLKGKPREKSDQFEFRSWSEVFTKISKMNVEVWAYPASSPDEDMSEYSNSGAMIMPALPYAELLKNLTAHEAGLVGSPFPSGAFNGALPNKLFEYIAAGIPVIAYNAPTAGEFLRKTGFGVEIKSIDEIPDVLEKFRMENTREKVWYGRKDWTMDKQVVSLEKFYTDTFHRYSAFSGAENFVNKK